MQVWISRLVTDRAAVGFMDTRKDIHKGGFTGAVFTHQSVDLS